MFNAAKFTLVGNNATGDNMFGRNKKLFITSIVHVYQFKNIISSHLPQSLTFRHVIGDKHIFVLFNHLCVYFLMSNFCPCRLAVCKFLNLVSTISLKMLDKKVPRILAYLSRMYLKSSFYHPYYHNPTMRKTYSLFLCMQGC
jgi:hypothetical protein